MSSSQKSWKAWGDHPVIVAIVILTSIVTLLLAAIPFVQNRKNIEYIGRVRDVETQLPVDAAKVTLEIQGAPPLIYTDSEGVYRFVVNSTTDILNGRIQVEAVGYEVYLPNVTLQSDNPQIEDIRLSRVQAITQTQSTTEPIVDTVSTISLPTPTFPSEEAPNTATFIKMQISKVKVEELFGTPVTERRVCSGDMKSYCPEAFLERYTISLYSQEDFDLRVIYDEDSVVFYTITSKSPTFNPPVLAPLYTDTFKLGITTYYSIMEGRPLNAGAYLTAGARNGYWEVTTFGAGAGPYSYQTFFWAFQV